MSGFSRSNLVRVTVALLALATSHTGLAQEHDNAMTIQVEAQPLATALQEFSEQSGLQVAYVATLAQDVTSKGARDAATPVEALAQILDSTGLEYQFVNADTVAIGPAVVAEAGGDSDSGNGKPAGATPRPVMMAQAVEERNQTNQSLETDSDEDEKKRPLEEIIVTGTNIRGIAPESSPTRTFNREDIQISGAATAQDFLQTLPQNFGGGSNMNLFLGAPNDNDAAFNGGLSGTLGSSANLRGLGSGSTLVLLNGHRLAPSSGIGDFVDISMIPASAIERLDVLTDGASSIYGGDAVAGVMNFVLRDDFEGVETALRYGVGTQSGTPTEYRASITGGQSWDTRNALIVYEYFKQDELSVADRAFSQIASLPNDLLPRQERHSVLASASQAITPNLDFSADVLFSRRDSVQDFNNPDANMFRSAPNSEYISISASSSWKISNSWFVDFSGVYGDLNSEVNVTGDVIRERRIDSDLWTADAKASGAAFRLAGGDVKLAFGSHYRREEFANFDAISDVTDRQATRKVYAFFGEALIPIVGNDNSVPGIERFEINVSGRFDHYSDFGSTANPKVGVLWAPINGLRLRGSYNTSFNPPPLGRIGATDLGAVAARTSLTNSIFGLTPGDPSIADVVAIHVFGTGKNLDAENSRAFTAGADFVEQWNSHGLDLSITFFDIKFENRLGGTPVPDNRSTFDVPNIAFNAPQLFPEGTIIFSPSADDINNLIDSLDSLRTLNADPLDAEILNLAGIVRNLSLTFVRGIDFGVDYTFQSDTRTFSLGIDGTYLEDFQQQAAPQTPIVEQLNTLYNPVGLKLRGRGGFAHDGFVANIFVNHTDGYRVDNTVNATPIDSWTTMDLTLSYDMDEMTEDSILRDTSFRLSVLNIFDNDPPAAPSNAGFLLYGFDPTNASPIGRFLAFEVAKRF